MRDVSLLWRAIIALTIGYSAFISEVFRAGIQAVDKGQIEAAKSLGLKRGHRFRLIILPQAIRTILPPLGNDFIAMVKDSSLVSVLGVADITQMGKIYAAGSFRFFETYSIVAYIYLILTVGLSLALRALERRLRQPGEKLIDARSGGRRQRRSGTLVDDHFLKRRDGGGEILLLLVRHLELGQRLAEALVRALPIRLADPQPGMRRQHVAAGVDARPARLGADQVDHVLADACQAVVGDADEEAAELVVLFEPRQEIVGHRSDGVIAAEPDIEALVFGDGRFDENGRSETGGGNHARKLFHVLSSLECGRTQLRHARAAGFGQPPGRLKKLPATDGLTSCSVRRLSLRGRSRRAGIARRNQQDGSMTSSTTRPGQGHAALEQVYAATTADELAAGYAAWAATYDGETAALGYALPFQITAWVARYVPAGEGPLLDAGCGTGLSGPTLKALGYDDIAGLDLSADMLSDRRQAAKPMAS